MPFEPSARRTGSTASTTRLLGQLFDSKADVSQILKSREIYRHLKNSADRIDRAADEISVIVIKRS